MTFDACILSAVFNAAFNPPFRASAFPRANYYSTALDSDHDCLAKRLDKSSYAQKLGEMEKVKFGCKSGISVTGRGWRASVGWP